MRISEAEIAKYITGTLGRTVAVYDVIDSTNNGAKLLAKNGAVHGSVLLSRQQTAGKGRLGRSFYSPPDAGIYMSVILRPNCQKELLLLTSAAAVAVCRGIQTVCGLETKIKWVNDIYYGGKKLCGILAESALGKAGLEYVVLGIGINVLRSAFPAELSPKVVSLEDAGVLDVDPNRLAAEILNALENCMTEDFLEEYRRRSCVLGKRVRVLQGNESFEGVAVGFDVEAHLHVRTDAGEEIVLCSGEVSLRGDFT